MKLFDLTYRDAPAEGYSQFAKLLQANGIETTGVDWNSAGGSKEERTAFVVQAIESADALWLADARPLDVPQFEDAVERRLVAGARALVTTFDKRVQLLERRGVEPLPLRIFSNGPWGRDIPQDQQRLLDVNVDDHPAVLRDSQLFKGVRRLVLQQPNAISIRGYAASRVMALPIPPFDVTDAGDLLVDQAKPELPVAAMVSPEEWRGQALVMNLGVAHDPYDNSLGASWPGITAGDNAVFCRNIATWLRGGQPPAAPNWGDAYALIVELEIRIYETTKNLLGSTWFATVPERIREKCEKRRADEGARFHASAYLDLTDYEAIWKQSWDAVFSMRCASAGLGDSKKKGLAFFGSLNELRKFAMHPTKAAATGRPGPAPSDLEFLRTLSDALGRLVP